MRTVRLATGLAAALAIVACEPVIAPLADTIPEVPAPSFAVFNPVVQHVTGSADFHWIRPSTGEEFWRTSSLTARKHADGSVTGTYEANIHGLITYEGRITCLTITGNEAWLGLIIEDSSNPAVIGSERALYVMDNAGADRSTALPRLSSTGFGTLDEYCQATPEMPSSSVYDLEAGNIHVVVQFNPVVENVTGSAKFHRTLSSGETYLHTGAFTARRYADGSVEGMYSGNGNAGPYRGSIQCFTIIGNEAWLGVIVERYSKGSPQPGDPRVVYVMDNGEGSEAPPDRSTAFPPLGITGLPDLDTYCAETPEIRDRSVFDLEAGNIQILP